MDSITQAALGAAIGEATLKKYVGKKGMLLGAAVATIPDLDIVFYLFYDKFEMLSIHRGFSHSIVFSVLGSILISLLLKRIKRTKEVSFLKLWLFSWLALFTHIILDTFTAYGTQLFLPFSDFRLGIDSINVVDPVYTLPLLLGVIGSVFMGKMLYNHIGIVISSLYLIMTIGVKSYMNSQVVSDLKANSIEHTKYQTMPVGTASINWYGIAKDEKNIYLKKFSLFSDNSDQFDTFPINDFILDKLSSQHKEKMVWFAKDYYTVDEINDTIRIYNLQVDMRGIVKNDSVYAPTKGYFIFIPQSDGSYMYSSGSLE